MEQGRNQNKLCREKLEIHRKSTVFYLWGIYSVLEIKIMELTRDIIETELVWSQKLQVDPMFALTSYIMAGQLLSASFPNIPQKK